MTWVVAHDVWPGFVAETAPKLQVTDWLRESGRRTQFAIYNDKGRLGTLWTVYIIDERSVQRWDLVWIEGYSEEFFPLGISVQSFFTIDGTLDELTVRLSSSQRSLRLHGERFPTDFSFFLEMGPMEKAFKIPLAEGGIFSGAVSPFAQLADLEVGQTWRMQAFNPIAVMTGMGERFIPMVVEVTGEETLVTESGTVSCLVVEAAHAKAWIDRNGAVQEQEVILPVLGKLRIVREAVFDERAKTAARQATLASGRAGRR